jgi:PAS domain S-box-containing protein
MDKTAELLSIIQELKAEKSQLQRELWRFRELVKFLPPTWDLDVNTNVFWWSKEFRDMLGYESEADFPNVAESWANRLHPDDKKPTLDAFAAHIGDKTGRTPYDVKYRLYRKDGSMFWAQATGATLRDSRGNALHVLGTAVDITEDVVKYGFASDTTLSHGGVTVNFKTLDGTQQEKYQMMYSIIAKQCKELGKSDFDKQKIQMKFFDEFRIRHI